MGRVVHASEGGRCVAKMSFNQVVATYNFCSRAATSSIAIGNGNASQERVDSGVCVSDNKQLTSRNG